MRTSAAPALSHHVYFSLESPSEAAKNELVAACREHLTAHAGTLSFSVGTLAPDLDRDVNDRDFDVALHLLFQDKTAHDRYQEAPRHLRFVADNRHNWKKVRVFDSYVSVRQ